MGSRLPRALLRCEADTSGPERFLITAQEPNYLHALGSRDSGLPQGPHTGLCPPVPQHRLQALHGHLPTFTYSLSVLTSNSHLIMSVLVLYPEVSHAHYWWGAEAQRLRNCLELWPPDSWSVSGL